MATNQDNPTTPWESVETDTHIVSLRRPVNYSVGGWMVKVTTKNVNRASVRYFGDDEAAARAFANTEWRRTR